MRFSVFLHAPRDPFGRVSNSVPGTGSPPGECRSIGAETHLSRGPNCSDTAGWYIVVIRGDKEQKTPTGTLAARNSSLSVANFRSLLLRRLHLPPAAYMSNVAALKFRRTALEKAKPNFTARSAALSYFAGAPAKELAAWADGRKGAKHVCLINLGSLCHCPLFAPCWTRIKPVDEWWTVGKVGIR